MKYEVIYYGCDNVSQNTKIAQKKIATTLEHYGVENPFQAEVVKSLSKQSMIERYGVENPCELPRIDHSGSLSKPHRKISNFLNSIGIDHVNETSEHFRAFNAEKDRRYSPRVDICIEPLKLVIEIYGDYYHANPVMYLATDVFDLFKGPQTGLQIWARDDLRKRHIESLGFSICIIWETDIKKNFEFVKTDLTRRIEDIKNASL